MNCAFRDDVGEGGDSKDAVDDDDNEDCVDDLKDSCGAIPTSFSR